MGASRLRPVSGLWSVVILLETLLFVSLPNWAAASVPANPIPTDTVPATADDLPDALIIVGGKAHVLCPLLENSAVSSMLGGGPIGTIPTALYEQRAALGPVSLDFHQEGAVECSAVGHESLERRVTLRVTTDDQLRLSGGARTTIERLFGILVLKETSIEGLAVPAVEVKRSAEEVVVAALGSGALVEATVRCEGTCSSSERARDRAALADLVIATVAAIPALADGSTFTLPVWRPAQSRVNTPNGSVDLCSLPGDLVHAATGASNVDLDPPTAISGTDYKGNPIQGCQWLPKSNLASVTASSPVGLRVVAYPRSMTPDRMSLATPDLAPTGAQAPAGSLSGADGSTIIVPAQTYWVVVQRLVLPGRPGQIDRLLPIATALSAVL